MRSHSRITRSDRRHVTAARRSQRVISCNLFARRLPDRSERGGGPASAPLALKHVNEIKVFDEAL